MDPAPEGLGLDWHRLPEQAEAACTPTSPWLGTPRSPWQMWSEDVALREAPLGVRLDDCTGEEVAPPEGTAEIGQTALAVMKSFVISGITFLPNAFAQGGWLFSPIVLIFIACVNAFCIFLLLECRARTGCPSFGEIASAAVGPRGKLVVQVSIVISQFGYCIAYIIFTGKLASSMRTMSSDAAILLQLIALVPLCLIRSVENLQYPNLIGDVLILFGIGVVMVSSVMVISSGHEPAGPSVTPFNEGKCGIFIGMIIFTFEGIPMILPIQSAMREPGRFWGVFRGMFAGIVLMFTLFGLLGYVAWGSAVHTVVLLNLRKRSELSYAVKWGYILALVLSVPLMFLPGARITELWASGVLKRASRAWEKNALRALQVAAFATVALTCQDHFDRFLAFVGAFCCAPIAFIYPPLFHLRLCAHAVTEKALDVALVAWGIGAVAVALYGSLA